MSLPALSYTGKGVQGGNEFMRTSRWNPDELVRSVSALVGRNSVENSSADPKSLLPDPLMEEHSLDLSVDKLVRRDPVKLIAALLILTAEKPLWYHYFLDFCANQCYVHAYEGKWRLLHKLARLQSITLMLLEVQERMSPEDFFGNIFKEMQQYKRRPSVRFILQKKGKVVQPQRRRGYNDHGSMRQPHEIHSDWKQSGPNPERPDYRIEYSEKRAILNFLYG